MRIVVTGVTGQVGAALLAPLRSAGEVIAADRGMLDLSKPEQLGAALDRMAPDLIVNPAAYTAVDRAEDERDLAFRVNAEAPGVLARWAAARAAPLVHFSTDYVFDGSGARPWREDDPTGPLSVYGASKLTGEAAIRMAAGPHIVIRTSWVYAPTGSNFLRTIARLAQERKELRVVADQFGAPTSAAVVAGVVSDMLGTALRKEDRRHLADRFAASGGLVHAAASGATTWHGFATAIVEGLRARGVSLAVNSIQAIPSAAYPTKARRPANSRLDLSRLRTVFGIVTPRWDEALAAELDRLA
jgi:dTDP-4-dehydrorhamnose reductase